MFSPLFVILIVLAYVGLLLLLATYVEHRSKKHKSPIEHAWVYALSLAVYCSAWTFYGTVGKTIDSGPISLTIYLGPTITFLFGGLVLKRLIRIKNRFRVTSIADLLSVRYERSSRIAALATVLSFLAIVPYIALQLKAIDSIFHIISSDSTNFINGQIGLISAGLLMIFTILFGVRRLDPTEHHPGIVAAVTVESIIKLTTFLLVGIWVVWVQFDGVRDIFDRYMDIRAYQIAVTGADQETSFLTWNIYILLAMSAILFLPRQFHMAVVENTRIKHVNTAMWMFPLYLLLLNLFVIPIAYAGVIKGVPTELADEVVIMLPVLAGKPWLTMLVYLGGFSAASSMVMVSTMTLATMATNHIYLPMLDISPRLGFLRRHLLRARWVAVFGIIAVAYIFFRYLGAYFTLVSLGMVAFVAALQFAPSVIGGLFWIRGSKQGAVLGLSSGIVVWIYTLLIPSFVNSGWLPMSVLENGPLGIGFLKPEALFGLQTSDPIVHATIWTLFFNVSFYIIGSLLSKMDEQVEKQSIEFIKTGEQTSVRIQREHGYHVNLSAKLAVFRSILDPYFSEEETNKILDKAIIESGVADKVTISVLSLAEVQGLIESTLAGSVGAAMAHRAMRTHQVFSDQEANQLRNDLSLILAEMGIAPIELHRRVDYLHEREKLLSSHAIEQDQKVAELQNEVQRRKQMEEALLESEEKYRSIIENSLEGIFIIKKQVLLFCNHRFAQLLGYSSPEDLINRSGTTPLEPESRHEMEVALEEIENNLRSTKELTIRGVRTDNVPFEAIIQLSQIRYYGETAVQGSMRDVSEQRRLEEQLLHSQKMEAIGRLAGGIAHDFNNLLTVISGNTELAMLGLTKESNIHEYVAEIQRTAQRAETLTRQLLAFSRKQVIKPRPLYLSDIIQDMEKLLRRLIGEDVTLTIGGGSRVRRVLMDPNQIEQIVINLVVNARDAMPKGGNIVIKTEFMTLAEEDLDDMPELKPGGYVRLSVSDTGTGIPKDLGRTIFEPFITTKRTGEGTGLGLSTVYGIVQQNLGGIRYVSKEGIGTSFEIYLPPTDIKPTEESIESIKEIFQEKQDKASILIVEDDPNVRSITVKALSRAGFNVQSCASGKEALSTCNSSEYKPELLLTDVIMPGMSGVELAGKLNKLCPQIRVLYMSGYSESVLVNQGVLDDHINYISKPFTLHELIEAVKNALK